MPAILKNIFNLMDYDLLDSDWLGARGPFLLSDFSLLE